MEQFVNSSGEYIINEHVCKYKFNKNCFNSDFDELDSSLVVWKIGNPNSNNRIQRN